MERDNALRRIEQVEEQFSDLVRDANESAEGTTQTPVVDAGEVDDLREDLTDARSDLVDELLEEELNDDE